MQLGETADGLDPRIHAFRHEIADIALADKIALPHYVEPVMRTIGSVIADLRAEPSDDSELGSQLLYGEGFALLDFEDGWAWGYGLHDHFVGFVRQETLAPHATATHIVSTPKTALVNGSDSAALYLGSRIIGEPDGDHLMTERGQVPISDVSAIDHIAEDPVAVAELFIGAPYLLGGRSIDGMDCSGLVQLAFALGGHAFQRDSDLQRATAGIELDADTALQRGDLIFFPEHVGVMTNAETLLHASGHRGAVCTEALADVAARISEEHDTPILARRRPS
ncbi:NlpC/P60 family protein [Parasphingopyxis sp.]|uniref:C40 family peptidase n=1 Tax=Parasphingopyxis sp. TaxID=1920299 RepID=UPI002601D816|nr:NlpC/P60 family protein [Parasphingopyxis sp.]